MVGFGAGALGFCVDVDVLGFDEYVPGAGVSVLGGRSRAGLK